MAPVYALGGLRNHQNNLGESTGKTLSMLLLKQDQERCLYELAESVRQTNGLQPGSPVKWEQMTIKQVPYEIEAE